MPRHPGPDGAALSSSFSHCGEGCPCGNIILGGKVVVLNSCNRDKRLRTADLRAQPSGGSTPVKKPCRQDPVDGCYETSVDPKRRSQACRCEPGSWIIRKRSFAVAEGLAAFGVFRAGIRANLAPTRAAHSTQGRHIRSYRKTPGCAPVFDGRARNRPQPESPETDAHTVCSFLRDSHSFRRQKSRSLALDFFHRVKMNQLIRPPDTRKLVISGTSTSDAGGEGRPANTFAQQSRF